MNGIQTVISIREINCRSERKGKEENPKYGAGEDIQEGDKHKKEWDTKLYILYDHCIITFLQKYAQEIHQKC